VDWELRAAGAAAVDVNAPMGPARLASVVGWVAESGPADAVDLGCGRGALAVALAVALGPGARVVGIDVDAEAVAAARDRAVAAGVADRCTFERADAADLAVPSDATTCVAASHAFGGLVPALGRVLDLTRPGGVAVLADGIWATRPDEWCRSTFGDLPTRDDLVEAAEQIGWALEDVDGSSLEEWDDFETAWSAGVEAVGTAAAHEFAASRREEYQRYRGVLGFAWVMLRRPG
jgi:cyclopropane fatty-acyl-phospholipid synthase-like methyltransferase